MNWRFAAANNFSRELTAGFLYLSAAATRKQQSRACHALYVGRGLKNKKKERTNFFHKSKQEKQGVPQNSCDLIMIMVLNAQPCQFKIGHFLLFTQKETTNDNARRE